MITILDWTEIFELVARCQFNSVSARFAPLTLPVDTALMDTFGIDIHDPRQLHELMKKLDRASNSLAASAVGAPNDPFFEINRLDALNVVLALGLTLAQLVVQLSRWLPASVRSGQTTQKVDLEPIDPATFKWPAIVPSPEAFQLHHELSGRLGLGPYLSADMDQGKARLSASSAYGHTIFMSVVGMCLLAYGAVMCYTPAMPARAQVIRLAQLSHVYIYGWVPEKYLRLGLKDPQ